ncbi:MAG: organic hydroperoxide resistance protein [Cyclobacteriaceae bacterium]|nr:organic hydroperoxide resistance protein [Cyclobacteriaceae bacterium]
MKALYETSATAVGGRNGKVKTSDGILDLEVRLPKSMGGNTTGYTNPEQLFAAGYAACFDNALNYIAKQERLPISSKVTAHVALINGDGGFDLAVNLEVEINGVEPEVANRLLEMAHKGCPYSRALRGNVEVNINLI